MKQLKKVSVIVPIYNVCQYLDRCLETIVNQTYKNMEIILIDDGSTDDSLEKCLEWKKKDKRIIVITKQNEGLGITRNAGIRAANGEYIIFIDSDDYVKYSLVEKLYDCITLYNADMAFCDRYNVIDGKAVIMISNLDIADTTNFWKERILLTEIPVHLWGKIFKRDLFLKNELWMTGHYVEDGEMLPKLLSVCNSIAQVKEPLYYYITDRSDSIMMSKRKQIIEQIPDIFDSMVDFLMKNDTFERMKTDMEIYMNSKYFRWFYKDLKKWQPYEIGEEQERKEKIEKKLTQYFKNDWVQWKTDRRKRFLLWGSPALKSYVIRYDIASYIISGELIQRYHFSSLISAMQKKKQENILECQSDIIANIYRKDMIDKDINNDFIFSSHSLRDINVIMIDFSEERYDIVEYQGNYYTKCSDFDKLEYAKGTDYRVLKRNSQEVEELWKESCQKFIDILKENFEGENVYLMKRYIHENMRDYDCTCNEKEMNAILERYYKYFQENYPKTKCITV